MSAKCLLILSVELVFIFYGFVDCRIEMTGVMHEADHAYSIWSTWWLHRLSADVPSIACVINLPCTFTHYLDLLNFFIILIVVF